MNEATRAAARDHARNCREHLRGMEAAIRKGDLLLAADHANEAANEATDAYASLVELHDGVPQ